MTEIPIIVVTWNSGSHIQNWLDSVKQLECPDGVRCFPYIVDNGSWDRTPGIIWEAVRDGTVKRNDVLWLEDNTGFTRAQNLAFRHVCNRKKVKYVATLNPNATGEAGWLKHLYMAALEVTGDEHVGMWGGPIRRPECPMRMSSAGHTLRSDGAFLDIDWNRPISEAVSMDRHFVPFSPCFAASLWSVRMLADVGLPANDQFMYYDDVDLGYRARLDKWKAQFVTRATAKHPLPNSSVPSDEIRLWRTIGRLKVVGRYFPEPQRSRILEDAKAEKPEVFDNIADQHLSPCHSQTERRRVYDEWTDKYLD